MKIKPIIPLLKTHGKTVALFYIGLFIFSTLFPIIASLSFIKTIQTFLGIMDIIVAVLCFIGYYILTLISNKGHNIQFYQKLVRSYKNLNTIPLFLFLLFFTGVHIRWDILIIGLAWRMFLFTMALSELIALLKPEFKDTIS